MEVLTALWILFFVFLFTGIRREWDTEWFSPATFGAIIILAVVSLIIPIKQVDEKEIPSQYVKLGEFEYLVGIGKQALVYQKAKLGQKLYQVERKSFFRVSFHSYIAK